MVSMHTSFRPVVLQLMFYPRITIGCFITELGGLNISPVLLSRGLNCETLL